MSRVKVDFFENREELEASAKKVVFTGMIDQYFDYKHGELEYRSLRFEHEVPYTRIIEHKHLKKVLKKKRLLHVNTQ